MNFEGRAVVIDPDIFAVGDVYELLSRDMGGKAIMARSGKNGRGYASSSRLMDCARLQHWQWEKQIDDLFALKRDYQPWIVLELEPPETVSAFEEEWNHFDTLNEKTKLLHNTRRTTQPWKIGLPFEDLHRIAQGVTKAGLKSRVKFMFGKTQTHKEHPDTKQRDLFFGLLRECLDKGVVTKEFLQAEIDRKYLRPTPSPCWNQPTPKRTWPRSARDLLPGEPKHKHSKGPKSVNLFGPLLCLCLTAVAVR